MPRATKPQPRQRGTIVPEGDGKYRVRVYIGKDADGKREYASRLVTGTISQAKKALAALVSEIDTNVLARPTGETIGVFIKRYLADVKANEVLAATLRGYLVQFNTHILPDLGKIRVEDLTTFRIQQWIGSLVAKGLSYASIRHAYVVLAMSLEQAKTWNMIQKNPADTATLPSKLKAERKEMQTFDAEQMHRFLVGIDTARPQLRRYKLLFHVLLLGGLRPSEALALRWSDVNLETGVVTIRRSLTQVTSGHWEIKNAAKTLAGTRSLTLPRAVLALIPAQRAMQAREKLAAGPAWIDGDFIFTTKSTGNHLMPNNVSYVWKRLCRHAGVPEIRLYDARHTATTLELEAGVDPKTVSQRRGHANVGFTLTTYGHVLKSMDQGAADALDSVMAKASLNAQQKVSNG